MFNLSVGNNNTYVQTTRKSFRTNIMTNRHKQLQYPFDRFASIRRYTSFDFLKQDPSQIIYVADTSGPFPL